MAVQYQTQDCSFRFSGRRKTTDWIRRTAKAEGHRTGDITVVFCSDTALLEINRRYLSHDYYTDIITFDYTSDDKISGDLFISLDTVKTNSEAFNTPYNEELHRTIIHGILHLCGINDKGPGEREIMEANENKALAILPEECRESQLSR